MNITNRIRYRLRAFTIAASMALLSGQLSALEVGKLRLLSYLGAPLNAELELKTHDGINGENLIIKLAPAEIYRKMGADAPPLSLTVRFNLTGENLVKITTADAIKEPYLSFIVQFRWPKGELYKEFSVLLDPQ